MKAEIKIPKQEVRKFLIVGRLMLAKYEEAIETGKNPNKAFKEINLVCDVARIKKTK